jgi:hypothetical protein
MRLADEANAQQQRRMASAFAIMDTLSSLSVHDPEIFEALGDLVGPALEALVMMYDDASKRHRAAMDALAEAEAEL